MRSLALQMINRNALGIVFLAESVYTNVSSPVNDQYFPNRIA